MRTGNLVTIILPADVIDTNVKVNTTSGQITFHMDKFLTSEFVPWGKPNQKPDRTMEKKIRVKKTQTTKDASKKPEKPEIITIDDAYSMMQNRDRDAHKKNSSPRSETAKRSNVRNVESLRVPAKCAENLTPMLQMAGYSSMATDPRRNFMPTPTPTAPRRATTTGHPSYYKSYETSGPINLSTKKSNPLSNSYRNPFAPMPHQTEKKSPYGMQSTNTGLFRPLKTSDIKPSVKYYKEKLYRVPNLPLGRNMPLQAIPEVLLGIWNAARPITIPKGMEKCSFCQVNKSRCDTCHDLHPTVGIQRMLFLCPNSTLYFCTTCHSAHYALLECEAWNAVQDRKQKEAKDAEQKHKTHISTFTSTTQSSVNIVTNTSSQHPFTQLSEIAEQYSPHTYHTEATPEESTKEDGEITASDEDNIQKSRRKKGKKNMKKRNDSRPSGTTKAKSSRRPKPTGLSPICSSPTYEDGQNTSLTDVITTPPTSFKTYPKIDPFKHLDAANDPTLNIDNLSMSLNSLETISIDEFIPQGHRLQVGDVASENETTNDIGNLNDIAQDNCKLFAECTASKGTLRRNHEENEMEYS